jgi:hypothetical protein
MGDEDATPVYAIVPTPVRIVWITATGVIVGETLVMPPSTG